MAREKRKIIDFPLNTDEDERDLLAKEHQEDLEVWETEFSFRTSELLTNYEQNNLLSLCLKRYGIT